MRTTFLCLLLALSPAPALASQAPPGDPVAVVAAVKGRVEVTAARGGAVAAAFGQALERGDRVTVGKGSAATLIFGDGNVVTLAERASLTIGGHVPAPARAPALPGEVFANVSQFATAGSRQTGLVTMADMRSDADAGGSLLLSPRNTTVLDDAPVLRWRAVPGATRYRVRLSSAAGEVAWVREVPAADAEPSLDFPAGAGRLAAGVDHEWEVEALDGETTLRRESAVVRVLPGEARASVRANLARIAESAGGDATAAARFLAGSYLSGLGLYDDAARQFEALAGLAPGSPEPHEALGNLYLKVGASDRAAVEFQRALALHREAR